MNMFVATNNMHKVRELSAILTGWELKLPAEAGIRFEHEEIGSSFMENALGKAQALFTQLKKPVIADDSGLVVPALGGEPGIYSARYGSRPGEANMEAAERNNYLLHKMQGVQERRGFFVCCMALIVGEERIFTVQEIFPGEIAEAPSGEGGFGYDPIFFLPEYGKTAAQLSDDEKNRISHRGRAGMRMAAILDSLRNNA
ncbi:RdgB/HAM1 family non-canonical purine NTP pyrophosphatase [Sediminispirochaeta smaragdinae]|jgi:XTP/dITP diphosphohydrolase|uniref:dITP/XTP pyrophosphatase n=1 Tax=Sediminispirochaeta smaragdinae (strain DSM 11293 / JCM 15392 / SEBR 4228) TaxID=573413 RepID=E1R3Z4_SEDSS|nr:RdgB/HAM1 family non-canonical purine NTP pyrophosphatase [Sediminispirochaeta smaragdinae]ADK80416.1 non-canonical purine NTP pyrophosphatase, rdgB/HAM1 family [Sediminispirochaeta smaragdinae DSM 11293]